MTPSKTPKDKSPQAVTDFFLKLRGGPEDTTEDKIKVTAKHFSMTKKAVQNKLKFWMSGPEYLKYFPKNTGGKPRHVLYDSKPQVIIDALNAAGSVAKAAPVLECSPVTLKKIMEDKGIGQVFGLVKK